MNLKFQQSAGRVIVYDADCISQPDKDWFDPVFWQQNGAIVGTAPGRGSSLLLETPIGPAVLRTYLRGGWAARLSRDRYLFTGYRNARPLAEVQILAQLLAMGLPVPQPLAGQCLRHGLGYSGALLTRRINPAMPLAEGLSDMAAGSAAWPMIGQCIRRFHDAGVVHPDLNARNILLGAQGGRAGDVYVIDFDGAYVHAAPRRRFRSNLGRLHRSLQKLWPAADANQLQSRWRELMAGYHSAG